MEVGDNYQQAFAKIGCSNVHIMHIRNRDEARDEKNVARVRTAKAIALILLATERRAIIFLLHAHSACITAIS
ncbi:MAG: hypothetical protein ACK58T_13560 [Phycisphaerae bacterium]